MSKDVIGVDPSPRVQAALRSGLASFDEPELQTLVTAAINSGRLRVQMKPEAADAFIIAVPTPLDAASSFELAVIPEERASSITTRPVASPIPSAVIALRPGLRRSPSHA